MVGPEKKDDSIQKLEESAREKALRLLDFRPRTKKELADKLRTKGFSESIVQPLLIRFEQLGLLDDRRFAIDRARAMLLRKGWGPRKLRADLMKRGVEQGFVHESIELAYSDKSQEELIKRELVKKFGEEIMDEDSEPSLRQKAFRFLLGRGFEPEKVKDVLGFY